MVDSLRHRHPDSQAAENEEVLTDLQRLELEHAQREAGALEDLQYSNALVTDQSEFSGRYILRILGATFAISMGTNASYFGFTCPASVLTYINNDVGPDANASLFAIIWTCGCAISMLLFGRMSDKFGRRWFVIGASTMGFIGGIIACRAHNMNTLVGANVMLGLSGGVHTCYGLTIGEFLPNKYKTLGFAMVVVPCLVGVSFAPIIGMRLIFGGSGWRWIYYIYLMFMALAIGSQYLFYKPPSFKQLHGGKRTLWQEFMRIDFVGTFLLTSGVVLFVLGVSWGGQPVPWKSAQIISLLVVGLVLLIVFVFWEMYAKIPNPLMPMYFFRDLRGFCCLVVIAAVSGIGYVGPSIIWPAQVAGIYASGSNPISWQEQSWLSSTVTFAIIGTIALWGAFVALTGHIRIQMILMACMVTAFSGALATANRNNKASSAAFSFLSMFADGMLEILPLTLGQISANDAELGTIFGILGLFRTVAGSVFTAVYLAIYGNKLPAAIADFVPKAAEAAGLPPSSIPDLLSVAAVGTREALATVPNMTLSVQDAVLDALVDARTHSYAFIYYASIPINVVALICCLVLKDYEKLLNTHVPRQVYKDGEGVRREQSENKLDEVEAGSAKEPLEKAPQALEVEAATGAQDSVREGGR